jgi:hypothetical protein
MWSFLDSQAVRTILLSTMNLLIGGVLVAIVKSRPALKKLANEREANLLAERAAEMEAMRKRMAKLEAERAVDRHKLNNVTQCLDALIMMIEMDPEKAKEAATRVKAMRESQMKTEALEKAAVHRAEILGAELPEA